MSAAEPLLPTRQALGTVLVTRTCLGELAQSAKLLEELGFAAKLGGQVVLIRPKLDMPDVLARRVIELEGDRVCVEEGERGARRTYALRCVLDAEPSEQQWREAVAELCSRLLQGQERHFTTEELRRTAEHTARLYESYQELDAWRRSDAAAAGGDADVPVRIINGLARIMQGPADSAAMSLIWAAWAIHLKPWTESGAQQLGGQGPAITNNTQPPGSAPAPAPAPAAAAAAAAAAGATGAHAPPAQQARVAGVGPHATDAEAQPHHQHKQRKKKPAPLFCGEDSKDREDHAPGHLDTWPPTPSPTPSSTVSHAHESGDDEDVETMDGPGSSGLPRTSPVSRSRDQGRQPHGGNKTSGGTNGRACPSAQQDEHQHQDRPRQKDGEHTAAAAAHERHQGSSRSRDGPWADADARGMRLTRSRSRSRSPSSPQRAQHARSRSPQQARLHFTEADLRWIESRHQWLLRQPRQKAAIEGPYSEIEMAVPREMLHRLDTTVWRFYAAWPKLFAMDGPYVMALGSSKPVPGQALADSQGRLSRADAAVLPPERPAVVWEPPAERPHVVWEPPRRGSNDGGRQRDGGRDGDRDRGRPQDRQQDWERQHEAERDRDATARERERDGPRSRSRSRSPLWRGGLGSGRSSGFMPTGRPSRPWEDPQLEPATAGVDEREERQWAERVHKFLLTRPRMEASAGTLLSEGMGVPGHFLNRGRTLMVFLRGFPDLWTLEIATVSGKQVWLLHANTAKPQQPPDRRTDRAAGSTAPAVGAAEADFVRRLYDYLVKKLPAGVEARDLKSSDLRVPQDLFGGQYPTVSAFLRRWRDAGLWRLSEDQPLVVTARTGGGAKQALHGLR